MSPFRCWSKRLEYIIVGFAADMRSAQGSWRSQRITWVFGFEPDEEVKALVVYLHCTCRMQVWTRPGVSGRTDTRIDLVYRTTIVGSIVPVLSTEYVWSRFISDRAINRLIGPTGEKGLIILSCWRLTADWHQVRCLISRGKLGGENPEKRKHVHCTESTEYGAR